MQRLLFAARWAADELRRREAGVLEDATFRTKPELAWSRWRQRHQAVARRRQYRRHLADCLTPPPI